MRGFTLFEVLLTILLLTLAFVALASVFSLGLSASGNNESLLIADSLAREKVEEIRNKTYSSVSNEAKAAVNGFTEFQREVTVTTPLTNLKQVAVAVYWYNKEDEISTALVTYVANL